jgi:tetratricopeptide (TPR) repeat protein
LYRLDALEIIPRLVHFLRNESGPAPALFLSSELEEIQIYSTNPRGDAQALPQRIKSLFDSLGYGERVQIEDTPSNYTSIHLVTWCRGRYNQGYENIPLEIQIRTALEDAWGEIDHKLKYKPPSQRLTVRDEAVLQSCLTHLNIMKNFVDGAAQYADQIRVQADHVTARRFISTTHRLIVDTTSLVRKMDVPLHIRTQIEYALEQQNEALNPLRRNKEYAEARVGNLRIAIREFDACSELLSDQVPRENQDAQTLLHYYLPLEIALCNFQLGLELKSDQKFLAEAVRLYQMVENEFPKRAIVRYRYGRALGALGDFSAAIKKLQEADELLRSDEDSTVDKKHWLRLTVPRNLGVFYWELAEAEKAKGLDEEATERAVRGLYLDAYKVTKAAYDITVDPDALSDSFDLETNYRGRIANNLLYFLEDFFSAGGTSNDLEPFGHSDADIDSYLELLERYLHLIDTPETLHTMVRHYLVKGRRDKAKEVGHRLLKTLRGRGVVDEGGKSHEEEMLRVAIGVVEGPDEAAMPNAGVAARGTAGGAGR